MKINDLLSLKSNYTLDEKKLILSYLLNVNKCDLVLFNNDIDKKIINKYKKYIKKDIPVQYLIGNVYFLGNKFYVNKDVLIPRFETEYLVEDSINLIKNYFNDDLSIVDIGTGSGIIAISLKKEFPLAFVSAVDISKKALRVALYNAKNSNVDIDFIHGNMLDELNKKYDFLISNPPYLYEDEFVLDKVKKYEPYIALYGGLKYYEEMLRNAYKVLNKKSIIAFEIGSKQEKDIIELVKKYYPDAKIITKKDLNNLDRYIYILNGF